MTVDRQRLRAIRFAAGRAVGEHYQKLGVAWVESPLVVPITGACENVTTLYRLSGGEGQYLAQTGQLFLEVELQHQAAVYCEGRSFRADRSDQRHLNEFCLIEEEFTWLKKATGSPSKGPEAPLDLLLTRITGALVAMLVAALDHASDVDALGGDVARIEHAVDVAQKGIKSWPAVTYRDALGLLNGTDRFRHLEFGTDLGPDHEMLLLELVPAKFGIAPCPVFITHYPQQIKFFNMKVDPEDRDVVLSADLLLPTAGESVGAAVREDHYPTLMNRLRASSMFEQLKRTGDHGIHDFEPYLDMIASGRVPPHAGYGIGLERVLQFILAEPDIRSVSGLHQLLGQLKPADLIADPR